LLRFSRKRLSFFTGLQTNSLFKPNIPLALRRKLDESTKTGTREKFGASGAVALRRGDFLPSQWGAPLVGVH
jgi:hypothetical protein